MKRFIIIMCVLCIGGALQASTASPQDSIGVETRESRVLVQYLVSPGETIYGISSKYGVSISELMDINPELEYGLKVG